MGMRRMLWNTIDNECLQLQMELLTISGALQQQ